MKVRKIELKNYQQFKPGLEIDLTYPKGHAKEGQPLDKVCIIGQSGTGKTTLLHLIKLFSYGDQTIGNGVSMEIPMDKACYVTLQLFDISIETYILGGQIKSTFLNRLDFKNEGLDVANVQRDYLVRIKTHLIQC